MVQASSQQVQNPAGKFRLWHSHARTCFFWMFAIAFVLRFGYILIAHTYKIKGLENNFAFGWEMGRIGRAIVNGRGFAVVREPVNASGVALKVREHAMGLCAYEVVDVHLHVIGLPGWRSTALHLCRVS